MSNLSPLKRLIWYMNTDISSGVYVDPVKMREREWWDGRYKQIINYKVK